MNARRLLPVLVLGILGLSNCLLRHFGERFDDMEHQVESLRFPAGYRFERPTRHGGNPPFFGSYPSVNRTLYPGKNLESVCEELKPVGLALGRPLQETREKNFCNFVFKIPSGWNARIRGGWCYSLFLSGFERPEKPETPGDAENVSVVTVQVVEFSSFFGCFRR